MLNREDQQPLLEIQSLEINFQQEAAEAAVKNLSLRIGKKTFTAIVGESGSGKSITALSILKLLPSNAAVSGNIVLHDRQTIRDLCNADEPTMRSIRGNRISMIFQEPMTSLNPVMRCGDQVAEVFHAHQTLDNKSAREKTISIFREVELPDPKIIVHRYPHELSGGQRLRVMIAMALASNPALLIADEPTTALDVRVQQRIILLLKKLQQAHDMSVLFITHDLGLVADIADHVIVMRNGTIIEQGPADVILRTPVEAYTKNLLNCRPSAHPPKTRLPEFETLSNTQQATSFNSLVSTEVILEIKDLTVYIRENKTGNEKTILDHLSFDLFKGELIGLVGESGCGKTTLGKAIVGLQPISEGIIRFRKQQLFPSTEIKNRSVAQQIQMVFQDPFGSLDPKLSIGNAIIEPLLVHGIGKNKAERRLMAEEILDLVKLSPSLFNRYPHEFSGGQRQRVCIARALVMRPSLLIFDESVSALDVSVQASILNLIADLKQQLGFSAIFISHDLSVIHHLSDRILVMEKGRIIEQGQAAEVFFHPKQKYTQQLIDAIPGKAAGIT